MDARAILRLATEVLLLLYAIWYLVLYSDKQSKTFVEINSQLLVIQISPITRPRRACLLACLLVRQLRCAN